MQVIINIQSYQMSFFPKDEMETKMETEMEMEMETERKREGERERELVKKVETTGSLYRLWLLITLSRVPSSLFPIPSTG